jgi:hypothetical protein
VASVPALTQGLLVLLRSLRSHQRVLRVAERALTSLDSIALVATAPALVLPSLPAAGTQTSPQVQDDSWKHGWDSPCESRDRQRTNPLPDRVSWCDRVMLAAPSVVLPQVRGGPTGFMLRVRGCLSRCLSLVGKRTRRGSILRRPWEKSSNDFSDIIVGPR